MGKIRHLPPTVISQIAAGEVIHRPAAVVKELIENAIDAQAKFIKISIQQGGLSSIRVVDNGYGMDSEDILLCLVPHATSKLTQFADIAHLTTHGFRGEALASIAAVSNITVASRPTAQSHGYRIHNQQETPQALITGMGPGTDITVEKLFESTPVRHNFLHRSPQEFRKIKQVVLEHALAHPEIGFLLEHDGRMSFHVPENQTLVDRARELFSDVLIGKSTLLQVNEKIALTAILGSPQLAKPGTQHQFVFINKRAVTNNTLKRAIKQAYAKLINPTHQPSYMVHLTLPSEQIDPNMHPRKEMVDIKDEATLAKELYQAIKDHLSQPLTHYLALADASSRQSKAMSAGISQQLLATHMPWTPQDISPDTIQQLYATYLTFPTPHGLIVVDQHAAHERIIFEQFQAIRAGNATLNSIQLAEPILIELNPHELQILQDEAEAIIALGFATEPFATASVTLRATPPLEPGSNPPDIFKGVLDDLLKGHLVSETSTMLDRTIAYLACRAAVKAGDVLTAQERTKLVTKLLETPNGQTCPHGRPTWVKIDRDELEGRFRRK